MSMEGTAEAASSLESGLLRAGSESDRAPTGDLASQQALSSRPHSAEDGAWFVPNDNEPAMGVRFTVYCALATTLVVIVLFAITGTVWYRYVLLPSMLPERTTQAPDEQQRKLPVVVVEATGASRAPLAHSVFPRFGRNNPGMTRSNTTPTTSPLLTAPNSAVATAVTRTVPEEDLLPPPL